MNRFTNKEKAAECRREVGKRRQVYPRLVVERKMSQADADRLIGLMEQMRQDYEAADAQDRPDLFGVDEANALELADKLRGFSKFGETPDRQQTMRRAAALLEEFARRGS